MWKDYSRRKICNLLHKCDIKGNYTDPSVPFPKSVHKWLSLTPSSLDTVWGINVFVSVCVWMFCITLQIYVHESIYSILFPLFFSLPLDNNNKRACCIVALAANNFVKTLHNNKFSCVYFSPGFFSLFLPKRKHSTYISTWSMKYLYLCMCECDCVRKCIQT